MVVQKKAKKRVVWQDIRPAVAPQKPIEKKLTKIQKLKKLTVGFFLIPSKIYRKIKSKLSKIKQKTYIILGLIIILLTIPAGYFVYKSYYEKTDIIEQIDTKVAGPVKADPNFSTVLPTDKNIKEFGGWTRISPPDSAPAFAYTDKINGVPVIISQQLLPDDFIADTEKKVEQLANSFNADQKITVGSIVVHIGNSSKGPQSVIFYIGNLLILIKSDSRISNDDWAKYINTLQ